MKEINKGNVKTEARKFLDLTDDEIRQIVNDIFNPKKITCIKKSRKWDEITCKIYTEWETTDDDGNKVVYLNDDILTLRNPFDYGEDALHVEFMLRGDDYDKLRSFCFAKGIFGVSIDWLTNNPYNVEDAVWKNLKN